MRAAADSLLWRVSDVIILILLLLFALFLGDDIVSFVRGPEDYPIGSEEAGFWYATPAHYLASSGIQLALCVAGVTLPVLAGQPARRRYVRLVFVISAVVVNILMRFTGD